MPSGRLLTIPRCKMGICLPYELEEEYTSKDEALDPWHIATNEFIEWFSNCWLSAGGKSFKIKANIAPHDSNYEFNLKEGKWEQRR